MRLDILIGFGIADVDLLAKRVFGQREHHRSGAAGGGRVEGAAQVLRDAVRKVDLCHPLGHLAVHAAKVDLLERLAIQSGVRHLPDQQDQRCGVLVGDVHAGSGIRCPRPARHQTNARPAGELAVSVGHDRRAALVAAHDQRDLRYVIERIQYR